VGGVAAIAAIVLGFWLYIRHQTKKAPYTTAGPVYYHPSIDGKYRNVPQMGPQELNAFPPAQKDDHRQSAVIPMQPARTQRDSRFMMLPSER